MTSVSKDPAHTRDPSGCTAVAALLTHDMKIYVVRRGLDRSSDLLQHPFQANAGDSRSVISVKGEVKPLSFDHKPSNDGMFYSLTLSSSFNRQPSTAERARIVGAGGYIEYGRVNGVIF